MPIRKSQNFSWLGDYQTLRARGRQAHITIGGHYPSFDYQEVVERIPGVDSIVPL